MSPDLGTPLSQLLCSLDMESSFCEHIHTCQYKLTFQVHLLFFIIVFIFGCFVFIAARGSSSCGEWELLSSCSTQACLMEQGRQGVWTSAVVARGLCSCSSWAIEHRLNSGGAVCRISCIGRQAPQLLNHQGSLPGSSYSFPSPFSELVISPRSIRFSDEWDLETKVWILVLGMFITTRVLLLPEPISRIRQYGCTCTQTHIYFTISLLSTMNLFPIPNQYHRVYSCFPLSHYSWCICLLSLVGI